MITEAVEQFWRLSPADPLPFPRDLTAIVPMALPLNVIELPNLTCAQIDAYLAGIGGAATVLCRDRALRGCLVAVRGEGAIFLDPGDAAAERRFTLAHEVGHFLLDYHLPRSRALRALGERIRPVLDGDRPATRRERVESVLAHVPIGLHIDLMERGPAGDVVAEAVLTSEAGADRFALELLAPSDVVTERLIPLNDQDVTAYRLGVAALLEDCFGLPPRIAAGYARRLQAKLRPETFRDRLGLP